MGIPVIVRRYLYSGITEISPGFFKNYQEIQGIIYQKFLRVIQSVNSSFELALDLNKKFGLSVIIAPPRVRDSPAWIKSEGGISQ